MTQEELAQTLETLQCRIDELERGTLGSRLRATARHPALRWSVLTALLLALSWSGAVIAADGSCPNGLPFCFIPGVPAKASEVNHNFAQIKEWTEQKVGEVGSADVDVTGTLTAKSSIVVPSAADITLDSDDVVGGGIIISRSSSSPYKMRLDNNEIEVESDKLYLNINKGNPVRIGGNLQVDNGLPITFHDAVVHNQSNGGTPEETVLGSTDRRICFLAGMRVHDDMRNESEASCYVKYSGSNWVLETDVDRKSVV